jgi:dephospho-CoA kinase
VAGARGAGALTRRHGEAAPSRKPVPRPLLIGLTGPIGCGKTTVSRLLAGHGATVIDADALVREVTAPGQPGHDAVLERFGPAFRGADGSLDRAALARHVFDDPSALAELERVVHPLVRPLILSAIDAARGSGAGVVAIEAIKLVEGGYAALCDEVWLVTCPEAEQLARLVGRGLSPADARQRARAQAGLTERLARTATRIIDTAGPLEATERRVEQALADAVGRRSQADEVATE